MMNAYVYMRVDIHEQVRSLLIILFSKTETVDQWTEVGKALLDFIRPDLQ